MDASSSSSSSSRYRHTCIPSVVPPGVDPTSVDFRTFFPYIPNEVKHRKRTSRPQLKVLEDVYRKDTKPNAAVRKKLAAELDMLPRAVQVSCLSRPSPSLVPPLNPPSRRAKDKQLRKRAAAQHLQTDESNTTTATAPHDEHQPGPISSDLTENLSEQTHERESPRLSPADFSSFAPDSSVSPTGLQQSPPATPVDALHLVDPDLYNCSARLAAHLSYLSRTLISSLPNSADRRKSLDVNCYRLMQHPYATVAREKNEALLAKSPLSPPGSTQALTRPSSTMGPIRSAPLPPYCTSISDNLARCLLRPQSIPPRFPARRSYENRPFAFASRAPPPSIPGPLPRPDFQFGESSSNSPQNASPEGDTPLSSSSGSSAQASSPDMSISLLHRWSFPRGSTTSITSATSVNGVPPHCSLREGDGDAEDTISTTPSSSMGCLSRFGSVASVTGSESSVMFSDVSSCVAVDMGGDPGGRRGSCGSGQLLETRMSGLNVNYHQNHGNMGTHPPSGYTSSSTMSPSDRHSPKETSSLSCPPLSRSGSMYEFGGIPHSEIPLVRRGSMPPAVHAPPPFRNRTYTSIRTICMCRTPVRKPSTLWSSGLQVQGTMPPSPINTFLPKMLVLSYLTPLLLVPQTEHTHGHITSTSSRISFDTTHIRRRT
ncbi:hypothetical protein EDC04DRAFT_3015190 [Pisolithus marmoratus]|nr:hypothetical protein EDC04DRAFT_3015190 [Pisolithus marmoratus]